MRSHGRYTLIGLVAASVVVLVPASASAAGGVESWGANTYGQLGTGTTVSRSTAGPVSNLASVDEIAAGREHALALVSGRVYAWGWNYYGQVGDGSHTNRTTPTAIAACGGAASHVSTGHYHSLAVCANGTLQAWGRGGSGQLGNNSTASKSTPTTVSGLSGVVEAKGGQNHTLALTSGGALYAFGANDQGQLGDGTTTQRRTPVRVAIPAGVTIKAIATGRIHSLALMTNGDLYAWGANNSGQIGDGTTTNRLKPVKVMSGVGQVAAFGFHTLALRNGTVYAWGLNSSGQLGDGTTTNRRTPVAVSGLSGVTAIGSGRDHSLAISGGNVYAWGKNDYGQLGDGTNVNRSRPTRLSGVSGAVQVSAGRDFSLARTS